MLVIAIILSLGLLGVIVFFVFSPKSSSLLRMAGIGALGLICLTLVICGLILIFGGGDDGDEITLPIFADAAPQQEPTVGVFEIVVLFIFLFAIAMIIYVAMKKEKLRKKAITPSLANVPLKFKQEEIKDDDAFGTGDDSFNLDDLDLE